MGIPTTIPRASKATATKLTTVNARKASAADKDKRAAVPKPSTKLSARIKAVKEDDTDPGDKFTCKRCGAVLLDCKDLKITELLSAPRRAMQEHTGKCGSAPHPNPNASRSSSTATSSKAARTSDKARLPVGRKSAATSAKRPTAARHSRSSSSKPSTSSARPSRPMVSKPKSTCTKAPSKFDLYLREIDEAERARKEAEARANAEFVIDRGRKRRLEAEETANAKKEKATTNAAMALIYGGKSKKVDAEAMPAAKRQKTA